MKKKVLALVALTAVLALPAFAQDGSGEEGGSSSGANMHLFDDLNGDGISDSLQNSGEASDPNKPSEESTDAEQPVDDILEGMEEVPPGEEVPTDGPTVQ